MTIDEPTRRSVYNALERALGTDEADTLMNLLPHHPLADLATRDDLHSLAVALRGEMSELRSELHGEMAVGFASVDLRFGEIQAQFGKVDARFGEMEARFGEMKARFGEINGRFGELQGQFGEVRSEIARDMRTNTLMLIMFNLAMTAIIVTLGASGGFA